MGLSYCDKPKIKLLSFLVDIFVSYDNIVIRYDTTIYHRREQSMANLKVGGNTNVLDPNSVSFEERKRQLAQMAEQDERQEELEQHSTYKNFAQLNRDQIYQMIAAASQDKQAIRILLFILEHMDKMNALICSYQVFMEALDISQATVARSIKYLKEHGFIYIYHSGSSNVYVLNDDLAWTSYGRNHKYCQFPANVVLSASEQSKKDVTVKPTRLASVTTKESKNK